MELVEKEILLRTIDQLWREHLVKLEHLRQAVAFRGYGQRDPLQEYKTESFVLFENMIEEMQELVTAQLMQIQIMPEGYEEGLPGEDELPEMQVHHINPFTGMDEFDDDEVIEASFGEGDAPVSSVRIPPELRDPKDPSTWGKVGRNEPCPCGSGKKYKRCHGKLA
jgi:preprotein translocase subunit SecA